MGQGPKRTTTDNSFESKYFSAKTLPVNNKLKKTIVKTFFIKIYNPKANTNDKIIRPAVSTIASSVNLTHKGLPVYF